MKSKVNAHEMRFVENLLLNEMDKRLAIRCGLRLEAANLSNLASIFIWSGKFNFYQEKSGNFEN